MKARLTILVLFAVLGLTFAAQALADPPVPESPAPDAVITAGDPILFRAAPGDGGAPAELEFFVSRDDQVGTDGVLLNWFDHIRGFPVEGGAYEGVPDQSSGWPNEGDTYYWQAYQPGCLTPTTPACASSPLAVTIVDPPAAPGANPPPATVAIAPQVETYLDKRPRRRTRKRRVKFKFSSNLPGASFRCLFAKGWADCDSPHVFRRLKPGRYRFKARAIVNGVQDPTPVSWVFRILRPRD